MPELSDRVITLIGVLGSVTPLLAALMSALSQLVILPVKIWAMSFGVSVNLSKPLTLNAIAIGPTTIGMLIGGSAASAQLAYSALVTSSPAIGASEPARSSCLVWKPVIPAPEPEPW